jgi:glutamine amidotransferase-like uncharacterized protein
MSRSHEGELLGMFRNPYFSVFRILLVLSPLAIAANVWANIALVYRGPGSCDEKCSASAAEVARRYGLTVKYVYPSQIIPEVFEEAVVWVQPGGDALELAAKISPHQMDLIRRFVADGGAYVGFCAGAFYSDRKVDNADTIDGLGLIPGTTVDYRPDAPPALLKLNWRGEIRRVYFEGGATFRFASTDPVSVIARYDDGLPATISVNYGRGTVVVTGAHPEAPEQWKKLYELKDPDGPDLDLAQDMFAVALQTGARDFSK